MKLYTAKLKDGSSVDFAGDDWIVQDGKYFPIIGGVPQGNVFFWESEVVGISVIKENYDPIGDDTETAFG